MKLQLNTNSFDLMIDAHDNCCAESTGKVTAEPCGKYDPANPNNPFDEAGRVHNSVIYQLRELRSGKDLNNEQIVDAAIKMVSSYKFKSKALQSMKPGDNKTLKSVFQKYGIIDGCIPFPWPWWPPKGVFGDDFGFPGSGNHLRTIDPIELIFILIKAVREGRVPIQAKQQMVDWENKVSQSDLSAELKANYLMSASVARYTLAMANDATNGGETSASYRVSPWWSAVADGAGALVGSLAGGLGTIVGAAAASGVSDALIDKANKN